MTSSPPRDLDEESIRRIARSFYVVRMVRYALLLVALTAFLVATLVTDAPTAVAVAIGVTLAAVMGVVVWTQRRYVSSQRPAREPSSRSPRD